MFLSLHTNNQITTQRTQTKAAARQAMIWWEENNGKKEGERKEKKENDVMNVHYAQCREMKLMEVMRGFVIFFDCAQWQSISNSVQIRAVNIWSAWYVVIFYIFLSIIHTQIWHTDAWLHGMKEALLANKEFDFGWFWLLWPLRKEEKNE